MNEGNPKQELSNSLEQFSQVTGEKIGIVFTWRGNLSLLGNEEFKRFIALNKEEVWKSLCNSKDSQNNSKPETDHKILEDLIHSDVNIHTVSTLRKIISLITQRSTGKSYNFWNDSHRPLWWPEDIPFANVTRKESKQNLRKIVESYKAFTSSSQDPPDASEYRDRSPLLDRKDYLRHAITQTDPVPNQILTLPLQDLQ